MTLLLVGCSKDSRPLIAPIVKINDVGSVRVGQSLGEISLTGIALSSDNVAVSGVFMWLDPYVVYNFEGDYDASWVFSPADNTVYAQVEGVTKITVVAETFQIPDSGFRQFCMDAGYADSDGYVIIKAAEAAEVVTVRGKSILSLSGIEYFRNIKKLDCAENKLDFLDISANKFLTFVDCSRNYLQSLDASEMFMEQDKTWSLFCGGQTEEDGTPLMLKLTLRGEQKAYWNEVLSKSSNNADITIQRKIFMAVADNVFDRDFIWINGSTYELWNDGWDCDVNSICVSNNDVYTAGSVSQTAGFPYARIWKNGDVLYSLSDETARGYTYSVCVSGKDVYASGVVGGEGKIWKNGALLYDIKRDVDSKGYVDDLYIDIYNQDVYAVGITSDGVAVTIKAWKNGVESYSIDERILSAMCVADNNVYIVSDHDSSRKVARVWKNGELLYELTDNDNYIIITSIFVDDGDVYMAGYTHRNQNDKSKVWKNGQVLYTLNDDSVSVETTSLYVVDGDVYVAGHEYRSLGGYGSYVGCIWENGKLISTLSGRSGSVTPKAIVVQ